MTSEHTTTDWSAFRMCKVCRAPIGEACFTLSGRVSGGRPDNVLTPLPYPHTTRRRRTGRAANGGGSSGA